MNARDRMTLAAGFTIAACLALAACTPKPAVIVTTTTTTTRGGGATEDLRGVLGPMLLGTRGALEEQSQGEGLERPDEPSDEFGGFLDDLSSNDDGKVEAPPAEISPTPTDKRTDKDDEAKGGERANDAGKPAPRAATATALGGKLSADQVNAVIDANFDRLSACSNDEVVVSVRATVSTEGRVIEASAVRSTPDDPRIRDCIATTFRTLEFPRVASEWPTRLSFDLRVGGS